MADGRKNNKGTKGNKGGGRKTKDEEQKLAEKLSPLEPKAFKALENGLIEERPWAVKLFFEYRFSKPKEKLDLNIQTEQPLFPDVSKDDSSK